MEEIDEVSDQYMQFSEGQMSVCQGDEALYIFKAEDGEGRGGVAAGRGECEV